MEESAIVSEEQTNNNQEEAVQSARERFPTNSQPSTQEVQTTHNSTYIEIIAEKDENNQPLSVLEVDLIISREKGQETRRLAINFAGIDVEKQQLTEKTVNVDRECFEQLKQFFCQLDWNS